MQQLTGKLKHLKIPNDKGKKGALRLRWHDRKSIKVSKTFLHARFGSEENKKGVKENDAMT